MFLTKTKISHQRCNSSNKTVNEKISVNIQKAQLSEFLNRPYKYGFNSNIDQEILLKGLTEQTIRFISNKKFEPNWLLNFRLSAFRKWLSMIEPSWSVTNFPPIDY